MTISDEVVTLSRYFVWADTMKNHFEEALRKRGNVDLSAPGGMDIAMYMSLWYGCLYVVIEAWRELGLRDQEVDNLLASGHADLLRRYRNAVFHYQKEYWPEKFVAFLREGESSAAWVRAVHNELQRYLTDRLNSLGEV
jgi:hypothetical protein